MKKNNPEIVKRLIDFKKWPSSGSEVRTNTEVCKCSIICNYEETMACERKSSRILASKKMTCSSVDTQPGHFVMGS